MKRRRTKAAKERRMMNASELSNRQVTQAEMAAVTGMPIGSIARLRTESPRETGRHADLFEVLSLLLAQRFKALGVPMRHALPLARRFRDGFARVIDDFPAPVYAVYWQDKAGDLQTKVICIEDLPDEKANADHTVINMSVVWEDFLERLDAAGIFS